MIWLWYVKLCTSKKEAINSKRVGFLCFLLFMMLRLEVRLAKIRNQEKMGKYLLHLSQLYVSFN